MFIDKTNTCLISILIGSAQCRHQVVAWPGMSLGANPHKMSLIPTAKQTGGLSCPEIFKFRWFLQSKSVNNFYGLLQPEASRLDPMQWGTSIPNPLDYCSPK